MTAQFSDLVDLDGSRWELAGVAGGPLWDAAAEGFDFPFTSSACWRGHVCSYAVREGHFLLSALCFGPNATRHAAVVREYAGVRAVRERWHGRALRGLDIPVPFTGGLLVGRGFVWSTYVHMGFHPAWRYRQVREVFLRDGVVADVVDRSTAMARLRDGIAAGDIADPDGPPGGQAWVKTSFTLDYARSGLEYHGAPDGPGPHPPA